MFVYRRYVVVEDTLAKGDISVKDIAKLGKELSELGRVTSLTDDRNEGADGEEMLLLVQEERMECETALAEIEQEIIKIMSPKDEADERGCILEVRAGTGKLLYYDCCSCSTELILNMYIFQLVY